jgi:hypothetical protein
MPSSENRLPDDFPDLTIPERNNLPAQVGHPMVPVTPLTSYPWRVGDRVLAPWEPDCLYIGTVAQVEGQQALIDFDDGDSGWVLVSQVRAIAVRQGQKVTARRHMGLNFHPAEVLEVRGEDVCLQLDADSEEIWVALAALRIPCPPAGPAAIAMQVASHLAYFENLEEGDRVWAPWNSATLFAGTVDKIEGNDAHIHFDDGDRGWVQLQQLLPLEIFAGLRVIARWKRGSSYFPGIVTQVKGEDVYVHYDDGDKEWTKPAALAIYCQPYGPDARPTKINRWRGLQGWVFPLLLGIGLVVLRISCR